MNNEEIKSLIEQHEGRREKTYIDTNGHPTIGVGFNLDRRDARSKIEALGLNYDDVRAGNTKLTKTQIDTLFDADVDTAIKGAKETVSNFDALDEVRQGVVVDIVFNLGSKGFSKFEKTIDAIEDGDWDRAADELEDSKWYDQVGLRGSDDVDAMRFGDNSGS
jgi:lysozyme